MIEGFWLLKKKKSGGEQDGGGVDGYGGHLSPPTHQGFSHFHTGYSYQRIHAKHQVRAERRTWPVEKNIYNYAKLCRMKELGGKIGVSVGSDLPSAGGGPEAGVRSPHQGNWLSQRRNLRLRVKQMICGGLNRMRISPCRSHAYLDKDAHPLEGAATGSWNLGIMGQSQGEGCC